MATIGDFTSLIFDAFCVLGCGGDVGLIFVGLIALVVFVLLMYKLNLGLDGVLVAGGFFVIIMSQEGYFLSWMGDTVLIVTGIMWGSIIWKYLRN